MSNRILYEAHPSMFRNNPIAFILCLLLCAVGIGILMLFLWWINCLKIKLTVTEEKIIKREGILKRYENEVYHGDIQNIRLEQRCFQRLFGVGTIYLATAGTAGVEVSIAGIPNPVKLKRIIEEQRHQIREEAISHYRK